jgi:hypothetical protein
MGIKPLAEIVELTKILALMALFVEIG